MSHLSLPAFAGFAVALPHSLVVLGCGWLTGAIGARLIRDRGCHWSWAGSLAPLALLSWGVSESVGVFLGVTAVTAARRGRRLHRRDLKAGGDLARSATGRFTPRDGARVALARVSAGRERLLTGEGLLLGQDPRGALVRIPVGSDRAGMHTLVVGATGSGKTVTQVSIAVSAISRGQGVIVVDPKGDAFLRQQLESAASRTGARFIEWSPSGPSVFNPFARGTETEIADKALAGERFTEPHYLRQAQRYVGHEVRVLRAAGETISLRSLVRHLDPALLEVLARRLPEEQSEETFAYLDSLTARQARELGGTRDRLAALSESDAGRWLDPTTEDVEVFDLRGALADRAVVLFRLDADRRPLLGEMLGAAIVQDLITTVAALQAHPIPSLVVIDEFAAVGAAHVARLFGRARSAGMSLLLGTQELSDLRPHDAGQLLDQVLGNLSVLIAHRQVVPGSAQLVSDVAGTRGAWSMAQRSDGGFTRTRSREFLIEPDEIRALPPGWAAVLALATGGEDRVRLVRVRSPLTAQRSGSADDQRERGER